MFMSELRIGLRPGTPEDAACVAEIWCSGWRDGHLGGVPDELAALRTAGFFQRRSAERVRETTVAVVDGSIAGFTMVVADEIEQVYVAEAYRGRGVAQRLLDAAEQQVADQGFLEAWLAVVASNGRARAFYARAGWVDSGQFEYHAFSERGPIAVPAHRYVKDVSPSAKVGAAPWAVTR